MTEFTVPSTSASHSFKYYLESIFYIPGITQQQGHSMIKPLAFKTYVLIQTQSAVKMVKIKMQ